MAPLVSSLQQNRLVDEWKSNQYYAPKEVSPTPVNGQFWPDLGQSSATTDTGCPIESGLRQIISRIAERRRFFGTKLKRGNRRNLHTDWLPDQGSNWDLRINSLCHIDPLRAHSQRWKRQQASLILGQCAAFVV